MRLCLYRQDPRQGKHQSRGQHDKDNQDRYDQPPLAHRIGQDLMHAVCAEHGNGERQQRFLVLRKHNELIERQIPDPIDDGRAIPLQNDDQS